jgi:hypothetical protein
MREYIQILLTALALAACSAGPSPNLSADPAPLAVPACPDVATSCAPGCIEAKARTFDPVAKCRSKGIVVVGCNALEERPANVACGIRRSDGLVLFGSSAVVFQNGDQCTAEFREMVENTAAICR